MKNACSNETSLQLKIFDESQRRPLLLCLLPPERSRVSARHTSRHSHQHPRAAVFVVRIHTIDSIFLRLSDLLRRLSFKHAATTRGSSKALALWSSETDTREPVLNLQAINDSPTENHFGIFSTYSCLRVPPLGRFSLFDADATGNEAVRSKRTYNRARSWHWRSSP